MPDPDADSLVDLLLAPPGAGGKLAPTLHVHRRPHPATFIRAHRLAQVLSQPPAAGQSVHVLSTGAIDLGSWLPLLASWASPQLTTLTIVTFSLADSYLTDLLSAVDSGRLAHGGLGLVTGLAVPRHDPAVAARIRAEFPPRGARFRFIPNHAKLLLASAPGLHLVIEASANLNVNRRIEQFCLTNDRDLYAFHSAWLSELLAVPERPALVHAERAPQVGYSFRCAGLGVLAATRDTDSRHAILRWKRAPSEDPAETARMAAAVVAVIRHYLPTLPAGAVVTVPPQGASAPGPYFAPYLARAVAAALGVPYRELLGRTDEKHFHGPWWSYQQTAYALTASAPAVLVIDDLITSGHTLRLSLAALNAAAIPAWGFAYNGRSS